VEVERVQEEEQLLQQQRKDSGARDHAVSIGDGALLLVLLLSSCSQARCTVPKQITHTHPQSSKHEYNSV